MEFSKNKKLNNVLVSIKNQLLAIGETEEESKSEILRYKKEFKNESDYNIAQYGNMLIYYDDIRKFYIENGYKSFEKFSNEKIWNIYKNQTGFVARELLKTA